MPAVKLTDLDERTFAFDHREDKSFRSRGRDELLLVRWRVLRYFSMVAFVKTADELELVPTVLRTKSANLSVTQFGITRLRTLTESRLDQTEITVLSPVQDAHFLRFCVQKDQELFLGKLHLQHGFLG